MSEAFPFQDACRLAAYFLSHLRHDPDYEDIHAETITQIWKQWTRYGCKWSLTTYARVKAKQCAAEWFRSPRGRRCLLSFEAEAQDEWDEQPQAILSPDPVPQILGRIVAQQVWAEVWARATLRQREMLVMVYQDEMTPGEAAARLGVNRSTVRRMIVVAMNTYRRRYGLPVVDYRRPKERRSDGDLRAANERAEREKAGGVARGHPFSADLAA